MLDKMEKIKQWMNSEEGQKVLDESYQQTKKVVDELVESRKIDLDTLYRPFNI
jgi:polyhydroxyalkanoate synthesis regulator phasin